MKKILISLTAIAALAAVAAPAAAQTSRGYDDHRGENFAPSHRGPQTSMAYIERLDWRVSEAARNGLIGRNEARRLKDDLRQVKPLAWKVQNGRASGWERQRFDATVSRVEFAVNRAARNDRDDHRGPGRQDWRR